MGGYSGLWGFCGGRAIDLFVNRRIRTCKDVDVAILRVDQTNLYRQLNERFWTADQTYKFEGISE